jgi:MFS family permease
VGALRFRIDCVEVHAADFGTADCSSGQETTLHATGSDRRSTASFWALAILLAMYLFAASAPSPLYPLYAALWHFGPTTLTAIYAVYAFGALVALLFTGRVSDSVGRRPVLLASLAVQIVAMFGFIGASGVGWLYGARTLQGFATGAAASAITAWLIDLQPRDRPGAGSVVGGTALLAGLAAGALGSSFLIQFAPDPLDLVFWLLVGVYVIGIVVAILVPDRIVRSPAWRSSMRPEVGIPRAARAQFARLTPSFVATWAIAGLYLSLGPALAAALLQSTNRVAGGLVIAALLGVAAITIGFVRLGDPRRLVIGGSAVLVAGVTITLIAVAASSSAGLYVGSVVAGLGFGPAFFGVFRSLAVLAPVDQRGALLAVVYIVLYLSFSVPTILAGIAVGGFGLRDTTYVYAAVAIVLASATAVAVRLHTVRVD